VTRRSAPACTAVAAALLILAGTSVDAGAQETYIDCDLTGPQNQRYQYSFTLDPGKGALLWVEGGRELKIERHTSAELLASYIGKFRDFPYDEAFFDLNLFSGDASVTYLHDPTPDEIASCEKQRSFGCKDPIVLSQHGETGSCSLVDRAVK
jgi:hypothetical protein